MVVLCIRAKYYMAPPTSIAKFAAIHGRGAQILANKTTHGLSAESLCVIVGRKFQAAGDASGGEPEARTGIDKLSKYSAQVYQMDSAVPLTPSGK